jgi:hypothetical protein
MNHSETKKKSKIFFQTYAILIFEQLKTPIDKYYATLLLGVAEVVGIVIFIVAIPFIGKRPMIFFSTVGCAKWSIGYGSLIDLKSITSMPFFLGHLRFDCDGKHLKRFFKK